MAGKDTFAVAMKLYLPDTNIFIYAYHGLSPFAGKVKEWIEEKRLLVSAIVAAEFLTGAEKEETEYFEALLDRFGAVAVDLSIARIAANYKKQFCKRKPGLKLPDALLAATAKVYDASLVTENRSDFPMRDIKITAINQ